MNEKIGLANQYLADPASVPLLSPADYLDAVIDMLERLADESRMGNYGIYFGNQDQGRVEPIGERKKS